MSKTNSVLSSEFLAQALPTTGHNFGDFRVTDGPEPDDQDFFVVRRGDTIDMASYGWGASLDERPMIG